MAETSIYDTIMNLPLFRGASDELITSFVEKTKLDFRTYQPGEDIVVYGQPCETMLCTLSGRMEVTHPMFGGNVYVVEEALSGRFFGVERLFGMNHRFCYSARALTRCGTMEFPKLAYLDLLRTDNVFLFNCLNYISRFSQKHEDIFVNDHFGSLRDLVSALVDVATTRESENVRLVSTRLPLGEMLASIMNVEGESLEQLAEEGLLTIINDRMISIPDRNLLVDSYLSPNL